MAKEKMDIKLKKCMTPEFRVSFPNVFKPRAFTEGQEAKYSIACLFSKNTDLKELKRAATNALIEKWGPKEKWPKNLDMPFRDGDDKPELDGYAGTIYINAKSKQRPGLVGATKVNGELPSLTEDSGDFYAGCYARASLIAYAYETGANKGVAFALQNIQKLRDGEAFSGKKAAKDEFEEAVDAGGESETDYEL